jgi:hypothetical protein
MFYWLYFIRIILCGHDFRCIRAKGRLIRSNFYKHSWRYCWK